MVVISRGGMISIVDRKREKSIRPKTSRSLGLQELSKASRHDFYGHQEMTCVLDRCHMNGSLVNSWVGSHVDLMYRSIGPAGLVTFPQHMELVEGQYSLQQESLIC